MSTADRQLNAPLRRRIGISTDPSEDELAQDWSLSPADLREISHCRGTDHKRRYALQLCMLRAYGRFLDDHRQAPLRIVNHLSRQLGLPPVQAHSNGSSTPSHKRRTVRNGRREPASQVAGIDRPAARRGHSVSCQINNAWPEPK
jgi:hypothetical protein